MTIANKDKDAVKLITVDGEKYGGLPENMQEKIALYSDGKCFVNMNLINEDTDLMNVLEMMRVNNDISEITGETSADIKARYSNTDKNALNNSILQKQIKGMFERAAALGASDISFQVRDTETVVKIRVDGDLMRLEEYTSDKGNSICQTIYRTMCEQASKTFKPKEVQDGRMKASHLPYVLSGARVATTPTDCGYYMVCRLLYKPKDKNPSLEDLGYESFQAGTLDELKSNSSGIIIVCGETGSGKSTTLLVITSSIITDNDGKISVITIEQPPEYTIFGWERVKNVVKNNSGKNLDGAEEYKLIKSYAVQTPVPDIKVKPGMISPYLGQIKACMRLDPNVIMIGEIRDLESAVAAVQASMSGHLVVTTIHANDALTIFPRIINLGVDKTLVCDAKVLRGLMAQTLLKKICPHCSIDIKSDKAIKILESDTKNIGRLKRLLTAFGAESDINYNNISDLVTKVKSKVDLTGVRIKNENGCEYCRGGVAGRTVVSEIIKTDNMFMQYVLDNKKDDLEKYWLNESSGVDILMTSLIKLKKGIVDIFDVEKLGYIILNKHVNLDNFHKLLNNAELEGMQNCIKNNYYADDYNKKYNKNK